MTTLPPHLRPRGRGTASNATGRYEAHVREIADDGWGAHDEEVGQVETEVRPFAARSALTYNASPDIGFDRSLNPYKGCEHGCFYCYARPKHAYLGLSPGLDFETKIFSKPNAPALLARELGRPSYRPAPIAIGADTDPYQPAEKRLEIMRGVLETLLEHRHPAGIVTKSALVSRDIDLLAEMARLGLIRVAVSVTTLDHTLARAMEPRASTPERRLEAISALASQGVPTAVMTAPMIPSLNDHEMEAILERARDAGATGAGYVVLRLPLEIADLAREWLAIHRPGAAKRVMALVRQMRGGRDNDPEYGSRMVGEGPYATLIAQRFGAATRRLGLNRASVRLRTDLFRRPSRDGQLGLFDDATPRVEATSTLDFTDTMEGRDGSD
jgi:DNA repair photolyase